MEMMGRCFQRQYKGRTIRTSIVSPFPLKQEVRLPVENTHPAALLTRLVRVAHIYMSGIIRPLSSSVSTPSEGHRIHWEPFCSSAATELLSLTLCRDSGTHYVSTGICSYTKPTDSAAYVKIILLMPIDWIDIILNLLHFTVFFCCCFFAALQISTKVLFFF